jgi:hypothetical protein
MASVCEVTRCRNPIPAPPDLRAGNRTAAVDPKLRRRYSSKCKLYVLQRALRAILCSGVVLCQLC